MKRMRMTALGLLIALAVILCPIMTLIAFAQGGNVNQESNVTITVQGRIEKKGNGASGGGGSNGTTQTTQEDGSNSTDEPEGTTESTSSTEKGDGSATNTEPETTEESMEKTTEANSSVDKRENNGKSKGSFPKTGVNAGILLYLILLSSSGALMIWMRSKRKNEK